MRKGTVDTYQSAEGWKKFSNIDDAKGDTDISQIDNTIYIENMEGICGAQLTISVKMKNTVNVRAYGFDLYLPDGVTVAKNANGFPDVSLSTARTTTGNTNTFNSVILADGSLRVSATLTGGSTFSSNDGEVAVVKVNIAGDMEEDDWPIILKQVTITDENTNVYDTDCLKSTLIISSYIPGDVNGDKKVNVTDFTGIANHLLSRTPANFNMIAADVNKDNIIDMNDLTAVSNIILYSSPKGPVIMPIGISNGGKEKVMNDATLTSNKVDVYFDDVLLFKDQKGNVPGSEFPNFIDYCGIEVGISDVAKSNLRGMCHTDIELLPSQRQKLTNSAAIVNLPTVSNSVPDDFNMQVGSVSNIGQDDNGNVTGGFSFKLIINNMNTNQPFHIYLPLEVKYFHVTAPITVWAIITYMPSQGNTTN